MSLLSSGIAAGVVKKRFEQGCFSRDALGEYERLWKNNIKNEILVGYFVRKFCSKFNDNQIETMFRIAQNDGVIPLIRKKGDFDWHKGLVLSLLKKIPFAEIIKAKFIGN
jgi:flavin-dependent dehydrogenase